LASTVAVVRLAGTPGRGSTAWTPCVVALDQDRRAARVQPAAQPVPQSFLWRLESRRDHGLDQLGTDDPPGEEGLPEGAQVIDAEVDTAVPVTADGQVEHVGAVPSSNR